MREIFNRLLLSSVLKSGRIGANLDGLDGFDRDGLGRSTGKTG
jgi:hypothetical protein